MSVSAHYHRAHQMPQGWCVGVNGRGVACDTGLAGLGLGSDADTSGVGNLTPGGDDLVALVPDRPVPMVQPPETNEGAGPAPDQPTGPLSVQMSLEGALRVVIGMIEQGHPAEAIKMLASIADQLPDHLRDPKVAGER